jgi:hypothetical protein
MIARDGSSVAGGAATAGAPAALPPPPQATPTNLDTLAGASQSAAATQNAPITLNTNRGLNSQNAPQQQSAPAAGYAPEPPANARPALANKEQQERQQPTTTTRETDRTRVDDDVAAAKRDAKRGEEGARGGASEDERTHGPQRGLMTTTRARSSGADKSKDAPKDEEAGRRSEKTGAGRAASSEATGEETRNVGGREFRHQKGAWIDTAYHTGQATTVIHRDSEQWRALIADEPALRRIADTLGGEVVIIWKGRAYRIKQ